MPVSLARRIRRIGLMTSIETVKGKAVHRFDPDTTPIQKDFITQSLRDAAKVKRVAARSKKAA